MPHRQRQPKTASATTHRLPCFCGGTKRRREPATSNRNAGGEDMKRLHFAGLGQLLVFAGVMIPATLLAQTSYSIVTLDGLGGTAGGANSINDRGWATGSANLPGDGVSHAALWMSKSNIVDLGSFGGQTGNSAVAWPVKNDNGLIVGISDTAEDNPLGEAFSCWAFYPAGAPSGKICR